MKTNRSPWLHQLHNRRTASTLDHDVQTDVVIVGAGIAGIATAFHILEHTDRSVVVVEAGKLAHGASGHNAGQLTNYFEKPLEEIVSEFGPELTGHALRAIEHDAWELLRAMYQSAQCTTRISEFKGYDGLASREYLDRAIATNAVRITCGVEPHEIWISDRSYYQDNHLELQPYVVLVDNARIRTALETDRDDFIGCVVLQKGCGNSAKICEEVVEYLESRYWDRFTLYEHSPITKVLLKSDDVVAVTDKHIVVAQALVLCTNGFEHFDILSQSQGLDIDMSFHKTVSSQSGTMAGYLEPSTKDACAMSYYQGEPKSFDENEEYYYMTRRHYDLGEGASANLVCVGGPVTYIPQVASYDPHNTINEVHHESIRDFIERTYGTSGDLEYRFTWHGLMGYTKNGVRMVGADPRDSRLMYNLGCNGVGLLPSIYGAMRIARIIRGDVLEPSIFDIRI
jgi:glycine/D-amino acid oxidase-like deaminating enzyme